MLSDNNVMLYGGCPDYNYLNDNMNIIKEFLGKNIPENYISPGDKVVIKPNFVRQSHLSRPKEWDYVITHTEIIRLALEIVIDRLRNNGEICIVDAPQTDSDFDEIIKNVKLTELVDEYQKRTKAHIKYYDLREERWITNKSIVVNKEKLPGDPKQYVTIDLNKKSEFFGKPNKEYYGADYDREETKRFHNEQNNIYIFSKTVLDCDVFINLPKLKTHKLGGLTCCLKNVVGTCIIKNSIPHHTLGCPELGGDGFKDNNKKNNVESYLKNAAQKILKYKNPILNYPFVVIKNVARLFFGDATREVIRNGSWYGNDTIWRSVLDLNKILLYADKEGNMCDEIQRKYIGIIDGVFCGEKNGPMEPDKKVCGTILVGTNPVALDLVAATIMGFDYKKIKTCKHALNIQHYKLCNFEAEDIKIISNQQKWEKNLSSFHYSDSFQFEPHYGWKGYIELK